MFTKIQRDEKYTSVVNIFTNNSKNVNNGTDMFINIGIDVIKCYSIEYRYMFINIGIDVINSIQYIDICLLT